MYEFPAGQAPCVPGGAGDQAAGRRAVLRALAALTLGAGLAHPAAQARTPGEVGVGETLRDAPLRGLNGPARQLSHYFGKPLVINVWASWCGPCRQEMASLERLAWREPLGQFTVIGVSTDDDPEAARRWLERSNATINHYIDSRLMLENMLGASQLPLTVLVDAHGTVLDKTYGARQWDDPASLALLQRTLGPPSTARRP